MPPESFDPTFGGAFKAERLLTRTGEYVTTAAIAPMQPPAEVVMWGSRLFIRTGDGEYREGIAVVPFKTVMETRVAAPADGEATTEAVTQALAETPATPDQPPVS